jgi:hypothetical protein
MAWQSAHFPDSLVALVSVARGGVGDPYQEGARVLVQASERAGEPVSGAEQLTVDVNLRLRLRPGAVAHPDGAAALPAGKVRQDSLGQIVLAASAERSRRSEVRS